MPAQGEISFAELLGAYVHQQGYSYGQLARLSGLPKRTIAHWLEGIVARPRDWRDLVRVAAALHLDEADTTRLLHSARHASVAQLLAQADSDSDRRLLAPWAEAFSHRLAQSPFQAIADFPHFVGRQREIEAIQQVLLGDQPVKLCSIQGMAGAGKTALATHLAYQLRPYFPDGVLWARLDNTDSLSVLSSFARAYGLDVGEYKDTESRSRVVRELLAHKRALIVLDNLETSDQAQPLLPPSGVCAVLMTSRRHDLAVTRGARRIQLGPFGQRDESLQLFASLLGDEYVEREKAALAEIAHLLGDLPLALDIAASRLAHEPGWSAVEFLSRLRREESRLGQLVYENQSVRLSFNISYERLSAEQQRFFHALGAFGGDDFNPEAAAYVAEMDQETAADHLRGLYALSLVQLGRPGRFRLHPLLRDLAREAANGENVLRRMAVYYARYAEAQRETFEALDGEIANLLAALQVAFEHGLDIELMRGAGALADYLDVRGLFSQDELHLGRAIHAADSLGDRAAQASLLCKLGLALIHNGQLVVAEQRLLEGLELAHQDQSFEHISALMLGYLGLAAYYRSDFDKMEQYLQESLELARATHQDVAICQILDGLNEVAQRRGNYAAAEAYSRDGLVLARRLENPECISLLLKSLATAIFERGGDYAEVSACLHESLGLARELGQPRITCEALLTLGYVLCEHGDYELAETHLLEALQMLQGVDFPLARIFVLCTLGLTAYGRQMLPQAADYLGEGLALAQKVGIAVLIAPVQNAWGWLYFKQGEGDSAAAAFSKALEISRQTGVRLQIAQALDGLAHVAAACDDLATARQLGSESLAILDAIGHRSRGDMRAWLSGLGFCC
jgi:tetratricopeptide (TPR) repeat protein/transcriptional regulator with XRE-family HTH domain